MRYKYSIFYVLKFHDQNELSYWQRFGFVLLLVTVWEGPDKPCACQHSARHEESLSTDVHVPGSGGAVGLVWLWAGAASPPPQLCAS